VAAQGAAHSASSEEETKRVVVVIWNGSPNS